jgi:hypothetical protein
MDAVAMNPVYTVAMGTTGVSSYVFDRIMGLQTGMGICSISSICIYSSSSSLWWLDEMSGMQR